MKLNNKLDVMQCVQRVMESMEGKEQPEMYIKLHTIPESLMISLKSFCNQSEDGKIELAVRTPEHAGAYVQDNLKLTKSMIDLQMQKSMIKCYSGHGMDEVGQAEQNWLVTQDLFLQFSDDMAFGMFTRDKEWIQFFMDSFQKVKENCPQICVSQCAALSYVYRSADWQDRIRVIEYMPCFSVALNEKILENGIHRDIPFRDELIQGILANFREYLPHLDEFVGVFETEGIISFMDTEIVEIFPYGIYDPIPLPDRCDMLETMISIGENTDSWKMLAVKEGLVHLKGIHMELRKKEEKIDSVWLDIHFNEQENEQIGLTDERVNEQCWNFFDYLQDFGYVYTKAETLDIMREILREYREKCDK